MLMITLQRIAFSFYFLWGWCINANAQYVDPREAKEHFSRGNYEAAMPAFRKLLKKDLYHAEYNYKMGLCYLRTNIDKSKATTYLERAVKNKKNTQWLFDLGVAYQYSHQFEKAVASFENYMADASEKQKAEAKNKIQSCQAAKDLIKRPVDVAIENIGESINSKYADYYPFVAKDDSYIVFTTRRGGVREFDGYYQSDIYVSEKADGQFKTAKDAGPLVNSDYDDQAVGLSNDGRTLFVYLDNIKEFGDIYISNRTNKRFEKITKMGENVNSSNVETAASISADGNTLFFASNKAGGNGGLDLYMTRKLPDGNWALPQNLGDQINSKYNEDFPNLSEDGKTLYFCSEGHYSMGGYDLFTSTWDPETNNWSAPKNLGYPINTAGDEKTISFAQEGNLAYMSALRPDGYGNLDIYQIIYPETYIFRVKLAIAGNPAQYVTNTEIFIEGTRIDEPLLFTANPNNGIYTIALNYPGTYHLTIDASGFLPYIEEINLSSDNELFHSRITDKIIKLAPNN